MNNKYALMEKQTITLIKILFLKKVKTKNEIKPKFEEFFKEMQKIWQCNVKFSIDFCNKEMQTKTGGGCFNLQENTIYLFSPSIIIALHEWKHKLQTIYSDYIQTINLEQDAIVWSHTICRTALPVFYKKNFQEKEINSYLQQNQQNFLYTQKTRKQIKDTIFNTLEKMMIENTNNTNNQDRGDLLCKKRQIEILSDILSKIVTKNTKINKKINTQTTNTNIFK